MHKGMKKLTSDSVSSLVYDQAGFDIMSIDHNNFGGADHKIYLAESGTDTNNKVFRDIPFNETPHWIGIQNCGTVNIETCSIQAESIVGDDLAKDGTFDPLQLLNYVELMPSDIIYGKFKKVALVKTSSGSPIAYVDVLKLIRGV